MRTSQTRRAARVAATVALGLFAAASFVAASAASAGEPPVAKAKRYCVYRAKAGSPVMEKLCKTREAWIREDKVDPGAPQSKLPSKR